MIAAGRISRRVWATVQVVLPVTGLACVADDTQASWALTKRMRGGGPDRLHTGQHLALTVEENPGFAVVSCCTPLD